MGSQGEARGRIHRLRESVDQLLYVVDVRLLSIVEVLEIDTQEAVGVFQVPQARSIVERERVCPGHLGGCA